MSTTTDKATAFAYSGVAKQRGTVFEITAGRVDIGASISFLSQYPGEKEFLMPPLSCLEVRLSSQRDNPFRPSHHHDHHPPPLPPFPQLEGLPPNQAERDPSQPKRLGQGFKRPENP